MKATQALHDLGQILWLDNITRDLLNSGTLQCYIGELSVTGLTSNPTIYDRALKSFVKSWNELLDVIGAKSEAPKKPSNQMSEATENRAVLHTALRTPKGSL